jgi:hypothetical protein
LVNDPLMGGFIAKFGGSVAHFNKAKAAVDAGKSPHAALFSDAETSDIVRNIVNIETFDARVVDFFGKTPVLKVSVTAKKTKAKKKPVGKAKTKEVVKAVKNALAPTKSTAPAGMTFSRDGKDYAAQQIVDGVKEHGQRGYSAKTGVPRTTLQMWLAAIKQA